jgi:hypothetical protein
MNGLLAGELVDANEFWTKLEYRICREIGSLHVGEFRGLWCDGVIPEGLERFTDRCVVVGRAWMGRGARQQEKWRFEFVLPPGTMELERVNWHSLLPAEDMTGWLELHQSERLMRITPSAAYPDRPLGD